MRLNHLFETTAAESRRIQDACASTFGRRYEDEHKAIAASLRLDEQGHTSALIDAEALCTVHMNFKDFDVCGPDLKHVATRLMLAGSECSVRVFNLRVPIKLPHERKLGDMQPDDWVEAAIDQVCHVGASVLLDALRNPCFDHGNQSCVLLPEGFDDYHATVKSSWLRQVVAGVTIHQIFPHPATLLEIRAWNAVRVSWSMNDATGRIRPNSYAEWLWANIDRVQNSDSGTVIDTTLDMAMSSNKAVSHILVAVTDPVARLVDVVEQAAFRVTCKFKHVSFADCLQRDDKACSAIVELLRCLPTVLTDAAETETFNIQCTAVSTDTIITHIKNLVASASDDLKYSSGRIRTWLYDVRRAVYTTAYDTLADSLEAEFAKDGGFFMRGDEAWEDMREHLASIFRVWSRVWWVLYENVWVDEKHGREAETTMWAGRLFECVCESTDSWIDLMSISYIKTVWRDVVCRVYPHRVSSKSWNPIAKWMNYSCIFAEDRDEDDIEEEEFLYELPEVDRNRAVDLLSNSITDACERLFFHPPEVRRIVLEQFELFNGTQFCEGRLWRRMLTYMLQAKPLSRLVASVIVGCQVASDDPRVFAKACPFELVGGTWRYTQFSNVHLVAPLVTRKCIATFANSFAAKLVLQPLLAKVRTQVTRVVDWMRDMNTAQKLNAFARVKAYDESSTDHSGYDCWNRWSEEYCANSPAWLFSALCHVGAPSNTRIVSDTECVAYRCALCLCLCYSHAVCDPDRTSALGFDQQFLYCGGPQCKLYGSVSSSVALLALVKLGHRNLQQTVLVSWQRPVQESARSLSVCHRSLEQFTRLSSVCHLGTYEHTMVPKSNCYTGFHNVFVAGSSFVAPGVLLNRDRLTTYDALVAADRLRLQETASRHLVFGDSTDHRPVDVANAMFTRMGVEAPQGRAVSREMVFQHPWWHRLHVYPEAVLYADVKERERLDHDISTGHASNSTDGKLQGVLVPRVTMLLAQKYMSRLGAPWMSSRLNVSCVSQPIALRDTCADEFDRIEQPKWTDSRCDPECMFVMYPPEPVGAAVERVVTPLPSDRTLDTLRTVHPGSMVVDSARSIATEDLKSTYTASTSSTAYDIEPSHVSTAGTYEDWGDSDLYESSSLSSKDAAALPPVLMRTHALDHAETDTETDTDTTLSASPASHVAETVARGPVSQLITDMHTVHFRSKQLKGRLCQLQRE